MESVQSRVRYRYICTCTCACSHVRGRVQHLETVVCLGILYDKNDTASPSAKFVHKPRREATSIEQLSLVSTSVDSSRLAPVSSTPAVSSVNALSTLTGDCVLVRRPDRFQISQEPSGGCVTDSDGMLYGSAFLHRSLHASATSRVMRTSTNMRHHTWSCSHARCTSRRRP